MLGRLCDILAVKVRVTTRSAAAGAPPVRRTDRPGQVLFFAFPRDPRQVAVPARALPRAGLDPIAPCTGYSGTWASMRPRSVRYQNVEAPPASQSLFEQPPHLIRVGDVGHDRPCPPAARRDLVDDPVHLMRGSRRTYDKGSFLGECERDPLADAAPCSGHEGDLARQPLHRDMVTFRRSTGISSDGVELW